MSYDEESLKKLIEEQHFKAQEEFDPEQKGIELKSQWPKLHKSQDKNQLKINTSKILKEILAIANSYRAGDGYVIIGIDGETVTITDSPFTETGLSETLDFYELMVKHVEKPVDYEIHEVKTDIDGTEKTVSVIVIPPSLNKPHVIKNYVTEKQEREQYIPVKKDTGIWPASRDDIELMYYDKANIEPEYALNILTNLPTIYTSQNPKPNVNLPVIFENYGRKPIILTTCILVIPPQTFNFDEFSSNENYEFELYHYAKEDGVYGNDFQLKNNPLIIGSNQAISYKCYFQPPLTYDDLTKILGRSFFKYYFWARDAVGNVYKSKFFQKY